MGSTKGGQPCSDTNRQDVRMINSDEKTSNRSNDKTAEFPEVKATEVDWCCARSAQLATTLNYTPVDLSAMSAIQGFKELYIIHRESGAILHCIPNLICQANRLDEWLRAVVFLSRTADTSEITVRTENTLLIAAPLPSQPDFVSLVLLDPHVANFALAKMKILQLLV